LKEEHKQGIRSSFDGRAAATDEEKKEKVFLRGWSSKDILNAEWNSTRKATTLSSAPYGGRSEKRIEEVASRAGERGNGKNGLKR